MSVLVPSGHRRRVGRTLMGSHWAVYDPDAAAYFALSGVVDRGCRRRLSDFCAELKACGLWSNLAHSAVFVPGMNLGSGTMAYSLNGAQVGTLVNGVAWCNGGLSFSGYNYVDWSGGVSLGAQCSVSAVGQWLYSPGVVASSGERTTEPGVSLGFATGPVMRAAESCSTGVYPATLSYTGNSRFRMLTGVYTGAGYRTVADGNGASGNEGTSITRSGHTYWRFGAIPGVPASFLTGYIAWVGAWSGVLLSAADRAWLYSLLSRTICADLNVYANG